MIPQGSLSRLKKAIKVRSSAKRREPDRNEVGTRPKGVGPAGSLPQPKPHAQAADDESETNVVNSISPDQAPAFHHDKAEQNFVEGVNHRSDWKSTLSATTKLLLRTVRDSADAFPPLKSVAGGLCFILENLERAQANEQAIGSLAPRIKTLAESLCAPVAEDDAREKSRRETLEKKLEGVHQGLTLIAEQGKIEGFLNNVGNADILGGLLEDVRDAIMGYQTSLQQDIYDKSCRLIESTDLALLDRMQHTIGAGYLSGNREGCLRGTRKDVLRQIERWLTDEQDSRVFWLNGLAGTGKSTIAQTFAEASFADGKLGASFFCSRDFEDRSNIQTIFPTLAFQLAYRYPQFRKALLPVLRANPEIGRESLCSQLEKVIIGPFRATLIPTLIIIDALDECKDDQPASAILSVLSRYIDQILHVKFFITGRPEPRVRTGFRLELLRPITEVLKLHDVERSSVDSDLKLFLGTRLNDISKTRSDSDFTENWPSSYDIDLLCKKSAGLFIYASTVVKFVASPHHLPTERLTLIISLPQSTFHEGKSGIDLLYTQVLEQAFRDVGSDDQELYSRFKMIVGAVLLVFYPLSRKTLSELLENCGTPSRISNTLRSLHSLLLVPASEADPIRVFHKSFPDFLTDQGRCKDERFFVDPSVHHIDILFSCLDLMRERLKKNICDLNGFPTLSEVEDLPARREACIGSALEYACRFWTKHLVKVPESDPHTGRVRKAVDEFFKAHLLFWIEVLSLTGNLGIGVYALYDIDQWYLSTGVSCEWTSDSQRLILLNFDDISNSPTKMYLYILPFCPSSSWLHEWHTAESLRGVEVVKGRPGKWGTCSRIVSLDHHPEVLAYHRDVVTVGLSSGDMVVLDAITGSRRSILPGHTDNVISLAFSLDGTLLVSGSRDNTVKLWDTQTGGVVKTFHDTDHRVCSVSISPDVLTIASGTHNNAICLWDVRTGNLLRIIRSTQESRGHPVTCVDFLPTVPRRLLSVSSGRFVQQWDTNGRKIGPQIFGLHVAFSPDGSRFVLCDKGPPTVRNSGSGAVIATLRSPGRGFSQCRFSPSEQFVAGVADATVYIWDVTSAHSSPPLIGTFVPHDSKISSLVYSSSIISAHGNKTIRFWQIGDNSPDSTTTNIASKSLAAPPRAKVTYIALQPDGGSAISVDSVGAIRIWDLSTGLLTALLQTFRANIRVSDARLVPRGDLVIVFSSDEYHSDWTISIWDPKNGSRIMTTVLDHPNEVMWPIISGDGARVFDVRSGRTWSANSGFKKMSDRGDLKLGPNRSSRAPSGRLFFDCSPARILDAVTREEVFRLPERLARPNKIQWDGRYLVAAYNETGELWILDFAHADSG